MDLADHGVDRICNRRLLSAAVDSLDASVVIPPLPTPHFALFLACDTSGLSDDAMARFAEKSVRAGAVYACCWGPGCEGFEETFDEAGLALALPTETDILMTTSHRDESLESALWFAVANAWPTPSFEASCGSLLAISVGSPEWAARIQRGLGDPERLWSLVHEEP
jgi:hypothetical protein